MNGRRECDHRTKRLVGVDAERCRCGVVVYDGLPYTYLSDDARASIAGLVAATGDEYSGVNAAGIYVPESVWAEIRAVFPLSLFEAWSTAAEGRYDRDAR